MDLSRLLRPRHVAAIGGRSAERVIRQCQQLGFTGELWPVHPSRSEVAGHPAVARIQDLPAPPDAAFVGVNRHATVDVVRALAACGAGGAVCYASGFAEVPDGADLSAALLDAAGDMPVVGPNCYGIVNYLDGAALWPDQHGQGRLAADQRGVAIVTQSSNIAISLTMQRRGLPIAYLATAGNQAQVGIPCLASAFLDDPRVSAVGLHVEGFTDVAAFEALAARARRQRVPLVVLKVGRSDSGRAAALTHTAAIAGSDAGAAALLRRCGVARVQDLPELLETLKLLHVHGARPGRRLLSLSCSGGEAALMADAASGSGLELPPLPADTAAALAGDLGALAAVTNPLDYHTAVWGDEAAMTRAFTRAAGGGFDRAMLVLDFPRTDRCDDAEWWPAARAFASASRACRIQGAVVAALPDTLTEEHALGLLDMGLAPLAGIREGMAATVAAVNVAEAWQRVPAPPAWPVAPAAGADRVLDEAEAKTLLARSGVPVPHGVVACDVGSVLAAAHRMQGPFAIKALGIPHKSEAHAVRLGVAGRAALREAAGALLAHTGRVLLEVMAPPPVAELLVGIHRDPPYGLLLTLGAGGTRVELLDDAVTLLLPVSEGEIRGALGALRLAPVLAGWRGRPPGDRDAAVAAVMAVVRFAASHRDRLIELDVNPLQVHPRGALAVDALIRMTEEQP